MADFKDSQLWKRVSTNDSFKNCILDLRENCILLGETIKTLMPGFTDHSVKHMDALWTVADAVFTKDEFEKFTTAEAFVLGCTFYFHDLGMSMASTTDGIKKLKSNEKYNSYFSRGVDFYKLTPEQSTNIALQLTSRDLHSENAVKFCSEKIPGLGKYIIEKESIRTAWSNYIGEVAASHHWSMSTIEHKFGVRGVIPSPEGGDMDLALVACALRIIDYAHINSERANYIDRMLRISVDDQSVLHWKAQENIDGPLRHENKLKFASNKPIEDVEAWWLFYDMALGLDREITDVSEYLATKQWSSDRFSLEGVQSVKNPKSFSTIVRTLNFEPIDIRFKPDSIERLVEILGGKTLYGNDNFAPLRELLQNSRDAILLKQEQEKEIEDSEYVGRLIVSLDNSSTEPKLIVKDNGVGMTANIIEDYLLGIASDYWNSQDFYNDFPNIKNNGFSPIGKFGIGFLSVFMIGEKINVESERKGKPNISLTLKGLGKHGSLVSTMSKGNFGTKIEIEISKQDASIYNSLELLVKARAPMLTFPVIVKTSTQTSEIEPNWWQTTSQKELFDFTSKWQMQSNGGVVDERTFYHERIFYSERHPSGGYYREDLDFNLVDRYKKWPDKQPEIIGDNFRLLAIPDFGRVLLCSRGIAVKTISLRGLTGIAEIENLSLTAARNETLKWNNGEFEKKIIEEIKPNIIDAVNKLKDEGMVTSRFEFIKKVASIYGNVLS